MRTPLTAVGPIAGNISRNLGIGNGAAGFLTTIPLLVFAVSSFAVGRLERRFGNGSLLACGMVFLIIGIICRSYGSVITLYAGTVILGMGISFANVLIPSVVKANFPARVGLMTGIYTTTMSITAGISGAISVPMATLFGWKKSLLIWVLIAALALIAWIPHIHSGKAVNLRGSGKQRTLLRYSMTWYITAFMGIQSLVFYCLVTWLPSILQSYGFSAEAAGSYLSVYLFIGILGSLPLTALLGHARDLRLPGFLVGAIQVVGLAALFFHSGHIGPAITAVCCGIGQGACVTYAMAQFALHTKDAADAALLSGFAQSLGYLFAAFAPALLGSIFDIQGSWTLPIVILLVLTVLLTVLGLLTGRIV
jgi:CP family cyanate transporter-like MFS transporter